MRALLGHRDFRLLLTGQSLSMFGDWTMMLVFGIWAKTLTGSNSMAGLMILAVTAPMMLGPLAGVLIDRSRRRNLMIITDLVMAAVMLSLLFVDTRADLWLLFAVAAAYGASTVVFGSARLALIATLLPKDLLGQANALLETIFQSFRLVGPLIGAGIFATAGGHWVAVIDAASFLCSAAALAAIRAREPKPERTEQRIVREASAGFAFLRRDPVLIRLTITLVIAVSTVGMIETIAYAITDEGLGHSPSYIGVILTAVGAGAVVGGLAVMRIVNRAPLTAVFAGSLALFAIGVGLLVVRTDAAVLTGAFLGGLGLPGLNIVFSTLLQLRTPNELLGRVGTAATVLTSVPQTLSIAAGAYLIGVVSDYRILLGVIAVVTFGCGLYAFTIKLPASPAPATETSAEGAPGEVDPLPA